jgi:hypothetical protein
MLLQRRQEQPLSNGCFLLPAGVLQRGLMQAIKLGQWLTVVGLLIVDGAAWSQAGQARETLVVSGHSGQAPVIRINGNSYVAVDALARLLSGSLAYQGDQVVLTVPGAGTVRPGVPPAFSKEFLKSGIETLSDIREWRSALLNAVENGYPIMDAWMSGYRAQAERNLGLASVAATTHSDRNALPLLKKEFNHMQELGNKYLAARKKLNFVARDSMTKDPLDEKILNCARSLAAMAASGEFQDDGSCN